MVEEVDLKWVKVVDRGNKGFFINYRSFRGEGDGFRYRFFRREEYRVEGQGQGQGGSNRFFLGQLGVLKEVVQEEGEIKNVDDFEKIFFFQDF